MPKKILVTGGAGFIGSHLVDRLASDAANEVVVLDNLRRGKLENLRSSAARITMVEGDIRERATVERAMAHVDTVYHLAAQSNVIGAVTDLDYSYSTNVSGTFEVLRAASQAGVRRLVFTSSREVYGDPASLPVPETAALAPKNAYGASKAAGEMYCRALGSGSFEPRIVRLANAYGTRDFGRVIPIFLSSALRHEPITLYGGKQILDFVWIDQIVDALVQVAEVASVPGPINIGCGMPTELQALAQRVIQLTDSASEVRVMEARNVEVARFVADTRRSEGALRLTPVSDPLAHLPAVMESLRLR